MIPFYEWKVHYNAFLLGIDISWFDEEGVIKSYVDEINTHLEA